MLLQQMPSQGHRSALARRQLLNGGDKRELHRFPRSVARLGIRRIVGEALEVCVRIRFEPGHVERRDAFQLRRAGGGELVRQIPLLVLAAFERIEASVGGDAVEPSAKRSLFVGVRDLEARETAPGAQIGLLHGVFGFVERAKHAVGMQFDFPAERFGEPFEGLVFSEIGRFDRHWVRL
jgi:hypothetical protein